MEQRASLCSLSSAIFRGGKKMKNVNYSLVVLLLFVGGCSLKKPEAPSLDMTIAIPVANEIQTMRRIVDERPDFLTVRSDSVMTLDIRQEIQPTVVGDRLSIPATEMEFQKEVGTFQIGSPGSLNAEISFVDIFPDAANLKGAKVPIPPVPEIQKTLDLPPFPIIRSVTVEEGQLEIRIDNGIIIPMEGVEIVLKDDLNKVEIGRLAFSKIASGSTVTDVIDLRGKTFSNDWSIDFRLRSSGSGLQLVEIDPTAPFRITATISPLRVTAATAELPDEHFSGSGAIPLPDTILVTQADVVSGSSFTVIVENRMDIDAEIDLSLDEMTLPSGAPVKLAKVFVGARTAKMVPISIDRARFHPKDPQRLLLSWDVATQPGLATLRSGDVIVLTALSQQITFSRVAGRVNKLPVDIPPFAQEQNIPEGLKGLSLAAATLDLFLRSGLGITLETDLEVKGTDDVGQTVVMPIKKRIEKGDPDHPREIQLHFDKEDKLLDLLNLLPRKIELTGRIFVGDGKEESVVQQKDFMEGTVRFTAPMIFSLDSTSIRPDPREITLKDETAREKLERNLISGKVITKLANHLPIGVNVRLQIATDSTKIFTSPDLKVPKDRSFSVPAGVVNSSTGLVERSATAEQTISLEKADLNKFLLTPLYSGVLIELPKTAGTVKLRASDFVEVIARVEATILVDEELVKR
jgi:hypothetical protein